MNMRTEIRPDLTWPADVTDVPKEVFVRPDIFEQELKDIFYGPHWHPVGHVAEIPNPGDFKTFDLGRVPLLIARGEDNVVRVFINACTHRATQVETAAFGNSKGFECPYHRWTWTNEGSLDNCPGCDDFSPKFNKEAYALEELKSEELYGLIFTTMSDNTPEFKSYLGYAASVIEKQLGHEEGLKFLGYQKDRMSANWKTHMDNDAYHPPLLHTGFRLLGWQAGSGSQFSTEYGHGGAESQLQEAKAVGVLKDPSLIEFKDAAWDAASFVVGLFPITIIVRHLDIISIRFAIPRAVDCTEVHFAYFAKADDDEEMVKHRIRQSSNLLGPCGMISMEDAAAFQRVQVGSHSPGNAIFQKGVKDLRTLPTEFYQNEETLNLVRWDHYRRTMGFRKEGEV